MQFVKLQMSRSARYVSIHDLDGKKESLFAHLETPENFKHPINHACTSHLCYTVSTKMCDSVAVSCLADTLLLSEAVLHMF